MRETQAAGTHGKAAGGVPAGFCGEAGGGDRDGVFCFFYRIQEDDLQRLGADGHVKLPGVGVAGIGLRRVGGDADVGVLGGVVAGDGLEAEVAIADGVVALGGVDGDLVGEISADSVGLAATADQFEFECEGGDALVLFAGGEQEEDKGGGGNAWGVVAGGEEGIDYLYENRCLPCPRQRSIYRWCLFLAFRSLVSCILREEEPRR